MKRFFFVIAFVSFVLFIFLVKNIEAQETSFNIFSQITQISCTNTDDCKRKAVLEGVCKPGEACPVVCTGGECAVDLVCNTNDECNTKAVQLSICSDLNSCSSSCQSGACVFQSSTGTGTEVDSGDIGKELDREVSCGKIGQSCCGDLRLPYVRLKNPVSTPIIREAADLVIGLINRFLEVTDKIVDWVSKKATEDSVSCTEGQPSNEGQAGCTCLPIATFNIAKLCLNIDNSRERRDCIECSKNGVWTALGCFESSFSEFLTKNLLGWGIGLAGMISLLCVVYAAIKLQLSRGNPEKIKSTQEMLTSCIVGLLLIIFAVLILRVIGVDILRIPGFG